MAPSSVMVVHGTTIHEFVACVAPLPTPPELIPALSRDPFRSCKSG
jgi:hypothetical protein